MKLKQIFLALLLITLATTILTSSALFAQEDKVITLGVPDWMMGSLDDSMFDNFEADHPGVNVVLTPVSSDFAYPPPPEYGVADYLDKMQQYVASADVLMISTYNMSVAATRAGYFLDLSPLVATDSTLNEDDFFPTMWQSLQWDQGIWGLPLTASFNMLIYRKAAFDAANLPYPTDDWTFDDFADAVRALTQRDDSGDVTLPGFMSFTNGNYLIRSLLEQGYYDDSTFPETPMLTNPDLISMVDQWYALEQEGVFGGFDSGQSFDSNDVPMTLQQPYNLMYGTNDEDFGASLLPGGVSGLDLTGVAVSAGTTEPELAYDLSKYLTENIDFVTMLFGMAPARQSLVGVQSEGSFVPDLSEDVQTLISQAALGALPMNEMRYAGYIDQALNNMRADDTLDAAAALQAMEEQAVTDLQTAADRHSTTTIYVATPVPTPILSSDEIALKVNVNTFSSSLTNQEGWDQFVADFTDQDSDVGYIDISSNFDDISTLADEQDCFYLPYNAISGDSMSLLLSIDPFLSADFDFDPHDIAPGVIQQLQRNGLTYAMPITLQPEVLWYNSDTFDSAGARPPENGWTVDEFEDALRSLQSTAEDDAPAPFSGGFNGGNYIMMLIAAYGGVPVDGVSNPPIVSITDTANVEAIRQVLDLARDGYLDYQELGSFSGGGGIVGQSPIYDDLLSAFSFSAQTVSSDDDTPSHYHLTTYPRGTQYTPVSYGLGTGYISATSQNPDACYRFLSALSRRPDLLGGMPARLSALDDSAYAASQTPDALAFYRAYFDMLNDPNLLVIPGNFGSGDTFPGLFVLQLWLYRAFDHYVLHDADLDTELQQAQTFSDSYLECTADIPPAQNTLNMTQEEQVDFFRQYARCAVLVDPDTESLFGVILQDDSGS